MSFALRFATRATATATASFPRATFAFVSPPCVAFALAPFARPRFYSGGAAALSKEQVQERVLNVLRDFDKVDASKLTLDSHFITDLGLDSLDQVEITIAVEEEFNIELSDRDADDILTARAAAEKDAQDKSDGCGQNFEVIVVSDLFDGKPLLARHRLVNDAAKDEISKIHAFSQVRVVMAYSIISLALVGAAATVLLAWAVTCNRTDQETSKLPFPNLPGGWPILGNILQRSKPGFSKLVRDSNQPAVFAKILNLPEFLVVEDPVALKQVFGAETIGAISISHAEFFGPNSILAKSGAEYKRFRGLCSKAVSKKAMKHLYFQIKTLAENEILKMSHDNDAATKGVLPIPYLESFAYKAICTFMVFSDPRQLDRLFQLQPHYANFIMGLSAKMVPWLDILNCKKRGLESKNHIFEVVVAIVQERRGIAAGNQGDDALSSFIQAQNEDGESLSDNEIAELFLVLLVAGLETTSKQTGTLLYYLTHILPETDFEAIQDEVRAEEAIDSESTISQLPLLDAFIKECMRISPVIPSVERTLKEEISINGITIPAGTNVHPFRDRSRYMATGAEFRLNNFLGKDAFDKTHGSLEYLPFGVGERMCLGMQLAKLEMKVILATILCDYDIKKGEATPVFHYFPTEYVESRVCIEPFAEA
ncbi:hypothetical protein HK100_008790 [Physocladia obscura]|uniref:Acyl carrier protein n=1 Tax=Physocladia obscura TaxID=109957 RepID=A0AAD5XFE1_9FUNG|nr:hypothetical protein HK100_008790 [Physocladia obscura]